MKSAVVFVALGMLFALGGNASVPEQHPAWTVNADDLLVRSDRRTEDRSRPVALAANGAQPQRAAWRSPANDGVIAYLWGQRRTIIALPALCGLLVLFGHLLLQALRWFRNRRSREAGAGQLEAQNDRNAQIPFIASLVEREHRRAIERARVQKEREAALTEAKKRTSRAA